MLRRVNERKLKVVFCERVVRGKKKKKKNRSVMVVVVVVGDIVEDEDDENRFRRFCVVKDWNEFE